MNKIPLVFRHSDGNRFTMPVLFGLMEAHGLDRHFEPFLAQDTAGMEYLLHQHHAPLAVAAYSFMTPHLPWVWDEVRHLRDTLGDRILFIGGGPHLVGDPGSGLKVGLNAVSAGEGEATLPRLLTDVLELGRDITGRVYDSQPVDDARQSLAPDAEWIVTGNGPVDLDQSFPISRTLTLMSPLEITRGCHWHCDFCQTATVPARHRSLDSVQVYLDELLRRGYLFRAGFICPSGFEYGADRPGVVELDLVEELLSRSKAVVIKHLEFGVFPSELRPNTISAEAMALIVKYASNRKVTIGAQSGSDAVLKRFKRGHTVALIERATALCREAGITPMLDFILGFPGETKEERQATINLARDLNNRYAARTQMHFFMPLSGTPLEQERPTFFGPETEAELDQAHSDGVCTNWWREGMALSKRIVEIKSQLNNK